jgi:OmpA-OmpF porin, OOP family
MIINNITVGIAAVFSVALLTGGCATKKHVREAIAPVQTQVDDLKKLSAEQKTAIGDLDRQVATADEKATDAGRRANQANEAAGNANKAALAAGTKADSANSAALEAQQGVSRLDKTIQNLNLDNYRLVDTKQVFFHIGLCNLEKESIAELDAAIMALGNLRNYVIEVEGFADKTGDPMMNVDLSRRRADAVVRYMTVEHNVPLRDVRHLGIGADFPNAVNKTREDRKNNRRVDVKIYALDLSANTADRARP